MYLSYLNQFLYFMSMSISTSINEVRFVGMFEDLHSSKQEWIHTVLVQSICDATT